jgi:tripartite-type tricarboxylate transporter receptor subunit TctC
MFRRMLLTTLVAAVAAPLPARAQNWPLQPVRIIVPYPPGSGTDIIGRVLAERLQTVWGQPVIIENRPGAGGTIGTEAGARAPNDGHTLLISDTGPLAIGPTLYARLQYDPVADFEPITLLARLAFVLVVNPQVAARSAREFVALARSRPGQIAYASVGNGSFTHLAMELFRTSEDITLNHVPYRGSAPALNDVVAGQVSAMFVNTVSSADLIRAGRLRALAIGSRTPSPVLPDVPTLAQALGKEMTAEAWFGMLAPRGTDAALVRRISADIGRVLREPELRARLDATGAEIATNEPQEFAALILAERDRWAPIVRASGARVD